jgi:hypothetical protein
MGRSFGGDAALQMARVVNATVVAGDIMVDESFVM